MPTPLDQLRAEFSGQAEFVRQDDQPEWLATIERENEQLERQRTHGSVAPIAEPQFSEARKRAVSERAEKLASAAT